MAKLIVDGQEIEVPAEFTLLQACEAAGAEIPRFCFHDRLSIAGNCRMCLVEVKGGPPKPTASCAMSVRDLRPGPNGEPPVILTRSPMVKKAREGVMEFLLINHPLDCPVCDQGGECDLQDQAMAYGVDKNRFAENKRAVEDKYIGPLVKTVMNRCIHCTRCVRFTTEVAGISELGAIGRGEDMEITTYLERAMTSELQGNVIDLCPVGALTAKPYEFHARPWELAKTESIDVMDALGSAIRIDSRGREVMRIIPRTNEAVNEEWISDKSRFVWDGLKTQRLDRPYVRVDGKLRSATWPEAFAAIAARVRAAKPEWIGAIAGDLAAVEDLFALKELMATMGTSNLDARQDRTALHTRYGRASYIFNPTIAGIDEADAILLIGTNPRREAPVLNARLRKRWRLAGIPIGLVGQAVDLTYPYAHLGSGPDALKALGSRRGDFASILGDAKKPLVIVGQGALTRRDGKALLAMAAGLAMTTGTVGEGWNGFGVLHTAAARVGALDIGFVPVEGGLDAVGMAAGDVEVLFNLGADEIEIAPGTFVIYQGTHGDRGAHRADVILPGAAYTEKTGTYVNTEGRVQVANRAVFPPGDAREDWAILRALSDHVGKRLPFDSLAGLRRALFERHPHLAAVDAIAPGDVAEIAALASAGGAFDNSPFGAAVADFYLTNPIARASTTMAQCSALTAEQLPMAAE